jgi:hypothetical protein
MARNQTAPKSKTLDKKNLLKTAATAAIGDARRHVAVAPHLPQRLASRLLAFVHVSDVDAQTVRGVERSIAMTALSSSKMTKVFFVLLTLL